MSLSLYMYVMPTIVQPLVGQPIAACVESYPHFLGLESADFSDTESSLPVDMLIGTVWSILSW